MDPHHGIRSRKGARIWQIPLLPNPPLPGPDLLLPHCFPVPPSPALSPALVTAFLCLLPSCSPSPTTVSVSRGLNGSANEALAFPLSSSTGKTFVPSSGGGAVSVPRTPLSKEHAFDPLQGIDLAILFVTHLRLQTHDVSRLPLSAPTCLVAAD